MANDNDLENYSESKTLTSEKFNEISNRLQMESKLNEYLFDKGNSIDRKE